jgi:hypothetical protein
LFVGEHFYPFDGHGLLIRQVVYEAATGLFSNRLHESCATSMISNLHLEHQWQGNRTCGSAGDENFVENGIGLGAGTEESQRNVTDISVAIISGVDCDCRSVPCIEKAGPILTSWRACYPRKVCR